MADNNELIFKVAKLEAKIEELEKQLKANTENDEKRHREFLDQQAKQHGERMKWDRLGGTGGIITAIAGILGVLAWIVKMFKGDNKEKGDRDNYNW